jgi:hypothetical protein
MREAPTSPSNARTLLFGGPNFAGITSRETTTLGPSPHAAKGGAGDRKWVKARREEPDGSVWQSSSQGSVRASPTPFGMTKLLRRLTNAPRLGGCAPSRTSSVGARKAARRRSTGSGVIPAQPSFREAPSWASLRERDRLVAPLGHATARSPARFGRLRWTRGRAAARRSSPAFQIGDGLRPHRLE